MKIRTTNKLVKMDFFTKLKRSKRYASYLNARTAFKRRINPSCVKI